MSAMSVTAVGFYGDMYGNEAYFCDHNLAIRKPDGDVYVGTYKRNDDGLLEPQYNINATQKRQENYLIWLTHQQEITEPSILVVYGEKFLQLLKNVPETVKYYEELNTYPQVAEKYDGFKGYITTYTEYSILHGRFAHISETKLRQFFALKDFSKITEYEPYYDLWHNTCRKKYDSLEKLSLDTAWRLAFGKEDEARIWSLAKVFSEHAEITDVQLNEAVNKLMNK